MGEIGTTGDAGLRQRLRRPSLLWGYALILLIGLASTIGIELYERIFDLPDTPMGGYGLAKVALVVAYLLALLRPLILLVRRHPHPLKQLAADVREKRWWLATCAVAFFGLVQAMGFAGMAKRSIAQVQPFYADPYFIAFDHALLGADAWEYTHAIIGPLGTHAIDLLYGVWHLVNIGLIVWLVLSANRAFQVRAVLTFQLTWLILGGFLATVLASVGPCFMDDFFASDRFAPLMERLEEIDKLYPVNSFNSMEYLLSTYGTDAFAGGISAMPSLHVAIAFLVVLIAFERRSHAALRILASIYFAAILVGSVHLAWHYLADGLASVAGVLAIWWACGRLTRVLAAQDRESRPDST